MDHNFRNIESIEVYIRKEGINSPALDIFDLIHTAFALGYDDGEDEGYRSCMQENSVDGVDDERDTAAYQDGADDTRAELHGIIEDSYANGHADGFSESLDVHYQEGYDIGWNEALDAASIKVCEECNVIIENL